MSTGVLASFWYYRRFDFARLPTDVPLILDSGAFSAYTSGGEVELDAYADWCHQWQDRALFAFNLDVIGDPDGSYRQWRQLLDDHQVRTVPVIHYGADPATTLPLYLDRGADRLAIGGAAIRTKGVQQIMHWQASVFRWLRDHGLTDIPVHGLGVHMRSRLSRLPWATTDSSAVGSPWRYARMALWSSHRRRWMSVQLDGRQPYKHGRDLRVYGLDPDRIARSTPAHRVHLVRGMARMECWAADDWQARTGRDCLRFLVDTDPAGLINMAEAVSGYQKEGRRYAA